MSTDDPKDASAARSETDWPPDEVRSEIDDFCQSERSTALLQVLERELAEPIDANTFDIVRDAGVLLVGENGFSAIVWAADGETIEGIRSLGLSDTAEEYLVRLVAVYGEPLSRALHRSSVGASKRGDWRGFGREIYFDQLEKRYRIEWSVRRYDGETLTIQAGLPSLARILSRFLETLILVDDWDELPESDRTRLDTAIGEVRARLDELASPVPDEQGGGEET